MKNTNDFMTMLRKIRKPIDCISIHIYVLDNNIFTEKNKKIKIQNDATNITNFETVYTFVNVPVTKRMERK